MDSRWCNFEKLEEAITLQFLGGLHTIHGPAHWRRVEQNGLWLASRTGADVLVVRLFAWFHDSKRVNESTDRGHGRRGAQYAQSMRGSLFELEDPAFELLYHACEWHTDRDHSDDPTIGTCWDSDRLDLGRAGIVPSEEYMSTDFGKEVAKTGSFLPFLSDEEKTHPKARFDAT